jgi:hypothetical protein
MRESNNRFDESTRHQKPKMLQMSGCFYIIVSELDWVINVPTGLHSYRRNPKHLAGCHVHLGVLGGKFPEARHVGSEDEAHHPPGDVKRAQQKKPLKMRTVMTGIWHKKQVTIET